MMNLSFNARMEDYYQRFYDLQEKLRKSEEERLQMEMKFNELVQISREEEQAHYKKLRSQYKKFLEEDRKRQERNEKIIRTLERIESRINMFTSKTERVKMLRHQYQNYLQRIARRPSDKREYYQSKKSEEQPIQSEPKPVFDYDKTSRDISMLKKAYGKSNEEKIEILDQYLQNLKSQKPTPEPKPKENVTSTDELKYFEDVSKKLDEGFNSNEANSIAEEIMNSIYSRHYKKDAYKDEPKQASKFTVPNYSNRYRQRNKDSGFEDPHTYQYGDVKRNVTFNNDYLPMNDLKNADIKYNEKISVKSPEVYEGSKERKTEEKKVPEILSASHAESPLKVLDIAPKKIVNLDPEKEYITSKTENDLIENEKPIATKMIEPEFHSPAIEKIIMNNENELFHQKELEKSRNEDEKEVASDGKEFEEVDCEPNNTNVQPDNQVLEAESCLDNEAISTELTKDDDDVEKKLVENIEPSQLQDDAPVDLSSEQDQDKQDDLELAVQQQHEEVESQEQVPTEGKNDDQNQQEENDTQAYDANAELYDQEYDSMEQPIEQLYGDCGKAVQQYAENGQPFDENMQPFGETGQAQYSYKQEFATKEPEQPLHDEGVESEDKSAHQTEQNAQNYVENDPTGLRYDENGEAIQQNNENDQPIQQYDENGQPPQQYNENGQPLQQYDENGQLIQQYDDNVQQFQQYDENGQQIYQYDGNGLPIQQYDENGQPLQQYDESGQPLQQYDENGQPLQQYDENGQPLQQYDENGQPLQQYDENGQPLQQYDENGQPLQQYDENGQPLQQYDENGQPLQQYDNGHHIQYDENGQPIYLNQGEELLQYDENGQLIQQYDENGQPITQFDQPYQHYDENGQPIDYSSQLPQDDDQSGQPYDNNQYGENQNAVELKNVEISDEEQGQEHAVPDGGEKVDQPKKNIMDLLDTDSESVKQNTSKVSNDSDFDFSNN